MWHKYKHHSAVARTHGRLSDEDRVRKDTGVVRARVQTTPADDGGPLHNLHRPTWSFTVSRVPGTRGTPSAPTDLGPRQPTVLSDPESRPHRDSDQSTAGPFHFL